MDKRTILALALVAVVIIITPKLFPSALPKAPNKAIAGATKDSAKSAGAATASSAVAGASAVQAAPAAAADSVTAGAARPESTTVGSATSEFLFSSVGAAPVAVRLPSYRALDKVNQNVTITSGAGRSRTSATASAALAAMRAIVREVPEASVWVIVTRSLRARGE